MDILHFVVRKLTKRDDICETEVLSRSSLVLANLLFGQTYAIRSVQSLFRW